MEDNIKACIQIQIVTIQVIFYILEIFSICFFNKHHLDSILTNFKISYRLTLLPLFINKRKCFMIELQDSFIKMVCFDHSHCGLATESQVCNFRLSSLLMQNTISLNKGSNSLTVSKKEATFCPELCKKYYCGLQIIRQVYLKISSLLVYLNVKNLIQR